MGVRVLNRDTNKIIEIKMLDSFGNDLSEQLIENAVQRDLISCHSDEFDYLGNSDATRWWLDYCSKYNHGNILVNKVCEEYDLWDIFYRFLRIEKPEFNDIPISFIKFCEIFKSAASNVSLHINLIPNDHNPENYMIIQGYLLDEEWLEAMGYYDDILIGCMKKIVDHLILNLD